MWPKDNLGERAPWAKVDIRKHASKSEMYKRSEMVHEKENIEVRDQRLKQRAQNKGEFTPTQRTNASG